jgi:D-glycero-alpha-D-manno-heptose-7-phosphate kinase
LKTYTCLTSAPLRVSFAGGGTDFPGFFQNYGGLILSAAIQLRSWVLIQAHSDTFREKLRVHYSSIELSDEIDEIKNDLIRETLRYFAKNYDIPINLTVTTSSDIPSSSGLGSSSSLLNALILNLCTLAKVKMDPRKIAKLATTIEVDIIGRPIGFQDHYATAFGGLKYIRFSKKGNVFIEPVKLSKAQNLRISNSLYLVSSGKFRNAADILKNQVNPNSRQTEVLNSMMDSVHDFQFKMRSDSNYINPKTLGELLTYQSKLKGQVSDFIVSDEFRNLFKLLESIDISTYKISGAGGGGFCLVIDENQKLNVNMDKLRRNNFKVEKIEISSSGILRNYYRSK